MSQEGHFLSFSVDCRGREKEILLTPTFLIDSRTLYVAKVPCLRSVSVTSVPSLMSG